MVHKGMAGRKGPTLRPITACDGAMPPLAAEWIVFHTPCQALPSQTILHPPFNGAPVLFQVNVLSPWAEPCLV